MAGRRTSLAALAGQKVEDVPGQSEATLVSLDPSKIVRTPLNKRRNFGTEADLTELGESLRRRQLQPAVVVSRALYIKRFPEHASETEGYTYVLANGERRWRSAKQVGLATIEAVIREEVAATRTDFLDAVASENLDRQNLDPVEEAHTVEALVQEFGSARAVATHRGKHETWVSQRRSLLRLSPGMQELVRSKQMPVEKARNLARAIKTHGLDAQQQADWWEAEQAPSGPEVAKEMTPGSPVQSEQDPDEESPGDDLTAVKSGPKQRTGSPNGPKSVPRDTDSAQSKNTKTADRPGSPEASLPWDAPAELDRILRRHMTPENRTTLAKLLLLE